jgi:hypothetical protein
MKWGDDSAQIANKLNVAVLFAWRLFETVRPAGIVAPINIQREATTRVSEVQIYSAPPARLLLVHLFVSPLKASRRT